MAVRWRFVLEARDTDTGRSCRWIDYAPEATIAAPRGGLGVGYAVFLANEWITALNSQLPQGAQASGSGLPFLGACRRCGTVTDDQHLLGAERDICDHCWTTPAAVERGELPRV